MKALEVVGFVGVIGSGKDYRADLLVHQEGYVRVDFKDELLDMASDLVGYDVRSDYEWFKQWPIGILRHPNRILCEFIKMDAKKMLEEHPKAMTGRMLLQRLGTEVIRKRDPDYWVKAWKTRALRDLAAPRRIGHRAVFCDYHSSRYDAASKHGSEKMAQAFLRLGLKDQQEIGAAEVGRLQGEYDHGR